MTHNAGPEQGQIENTSAGHVEQSDDLALGLIPCRFYLWDFFIAGVIKIARGLSVPIEFLNCFIFNPSGGLV